MKGYWEARLTESLALTTAGDYDIAYDYDEAGRVIAEKITGSITRTTNYTYDEEDNVATETILANGLTVTKTYTYTDGNITHVSVKTV